MTGSGRGVLIAGILLSVFAVAFQFIGLATAIPTVMVSFDAAHLYPWAFTTMVSGMLAATIVAGRVADIRGPSAPMYSGFALFAAGLVLGWLAPNVGTMLAARAVQGLGAGALNLTLLVTVAHGFEAHERPRVMALVSFCWLLPAFVGPPLAAWLTGIDWRLVFISVLPLIAAAVLLTLPGLRMVQARFRAGEAAVAPIAVLPTIAVTLGPSLILLAGQDLGRVSLVSALAGVAALSWGLPKVLAPGTLGLAPGIPSVALSRALQAGSFFAAEAILLVTLQQLRGLSPFEVGWALTVGSVGWAGGSWLQSQAWVRLDRDVYVTVGAATSALGIGAIALFAWWPQLPLPVALGAWVVAGLGMGLAMPSSAVAVMSLSSRFEQGRNQSSVQVAESVGNSAVTAVAGGVYTALLATPPDGLAYTATFVLLSGASLLAIAVSRRIGRIPNELSVHGILDP